MAIYDAKFAGDQCLSKSFTSFDAITRQIRRKIKEGKSQIRPQYLEQYYNVKGFYPESSKIHDTASDRILNAVVDALNGDDHLPRFLVVVVDKDILNYDIKEFDYGLYKNLAMITNWLTREVDIAIHRKKKSIRNKKPGALGPEDDPVVIYVDMMYRPERKDVSRKLKNICDARYKFNCALHEAAEDQNHRVMSIRSCTSLDDFDGSGNLTNRGKINLWYEIDDLLERFDEGSMKLIPRLHKKFRKQQSSSQDNMSFFNDCTANNFKHQ